MFSIRLVPRSSGLPAALVIGATLLGGAASGALANCPGGVKPIATIDNTFGIAEVKSVGQNLYRPASAGIKLCVGDMLRTGSKGRIRVVFDDREEARNIGPSVVNIGDDTEIGIARFLRDDHGRRKGVVDLIKGALRTFFKTFSGEQSEFAVRTGAAFCGIRGSEGISIHVPERRTVEHLMDHGLMVCRSPAGDIPVRGEQQIRIVGGQHGPVRPLDRVRYSAVSRSMEVPRARGCQALAGTWAWFVNGDVTFESSSAQGSAGTHRQGGRSGTWSCRDGTVRMTWRHGFVDVLHLSDDGGSISGRGWRRDDPRLGISGGHAVSGRRK
jgi:hypothetical protein